MSKPLTRAVAVFSLLVPSLFVLVLVSWYGRTPADAEFTGLFSADTPTYLCYARAASESPTLLSYANPFDVRETPAPVFVNLHLTVTGWMLAAGLAPDVIEHGTRWVLGVLMFLGLARLVRAFVPRGPWFWSAFLVLALGGGIAWLVEWDWLGSLDRWAAATEARQSSYYWWFLDLFRLLLYPTELLYHVLMFVMLGEMARRRYARANLWYALLCACNPFAAVQASGVVLGMTLLAPRTSGFRWRLGSWVIAGIFVLFYTVLVKLDPVGESIATQHRGVYPDPLPWADLFVGHGLGLVGLAALVVDRRFRARFFKHPLALPVLGLVVWTVILLEHSRVIEEDSMQPLHFSRGYAYLGVWLITFSWLAFRLRHAREWARVLIAAALVLVVLPDNLLFVRDIAISEPFRPVLMWEDETGEAYDFVRDLPGERHVLSDNWHGGAWLCSTTRHRFAFGTPLTTPFYDERKAEVEAFRRDPTREPPLVRWADTIMVYQRDARLREAAQSAGWREAFHNDSWTVFVRE